MKKRLLVLAATVGAFFAFAGSALAWQYPPADQCYPARVGQSFVAYLNGVRQGTFRCEWNPNAPPPSTRWVRIGP